MTDPAFTEARLEALTAQMAELTHEILVRFDELGPLVAEAVRADNGRRACLASLGRETGTPAVELLVEVLHGRLSALRPWVPFVTKESADRAAEALKVSTKTRQAYVV
jgi:hypothetical protein